MSAILLVSGVACCMDLAQWGQLRLLLARWQQTLTRGPVITVEQFDDVSALLSGK